MNTMMNAALDAADRGWPTFRLGYRQKTPLSGSNGFKDATTDPDILREWFNDVRWNIGLATGGQSRLVVVDIDTEHGGDDSIAALQGENGLLPDTAMVKTGSGWHLYYETPEGVDIPPSAGKLGLGIDIRGTGGYVVYPPSVHPNGSVYQWYNENEIASVPNWLIEKTTTKEKRIGVPSALIGNMIPMGQRNQVATKIAGFFRKYGFEQAQIMNQLRVLPFEHPLPEYELGIIAWSVSRYPKEHSFIENEYKLDLHNLEKEF